MVFQQHSTFKFLAATAFLASAASAAAAPPVAYSVGKDVFLTSPTGTGTVKVWSGPGKMAVASLDLDPSSNRIAVLGTDRIIRIVSYSAAGVGGAVATIAADNCVPNGMDFHPSDGSLLISRWCSASNTLEVRRYANGGLSGTIGSYGNPQTNAISVIRWTPDGSGFFIGHVSDNGPSQIERRSLALPDAPLVVWSRSGAALPGWFDVARCPSGDSSCSKLIVTDGSTISAVPYDGFGGGTPVTLVSPGVNGHYSPDNSEVLYKWQLRNSYQLYVSGPGGVRTVVSKGDVGALDWRP